MQKVIGALVGLLTVSAAAFGGNTEQHELTPKVVYGWILDACEHHVLGDSIPVEKGISIPCPPSSLRSDGRTGVAKAIFDCERTGGVVASKETGVCIYKPADTPWDMSPLLR